MKIGAISLFVIVILGTFYFLTLKTNDSVVGTTEVGGTYETHKNVEYGFEFKYRTSPSGYTLINAPVTGNEIEGFETGVILMRTNEYEAMKTGGDRGGPPIINITVYSGIKPTLEEWLVENQGFTNYQSKASIYEIDGNEGLIYSWEGMFDGETVAVKVEDRIYLFEGSSHSGGSDDDQRGDFRQILRSVKLQ